MTTTQGAGLGGDMGGGRETREEEEEEKEEEGASCGCYVHCGLYLFDPLLFKHRKKEKEGDRKRKEKDTVERDREWERWRRRWGDGKWKGGDEDVSIFGWLSLEESLYPSHSRTLAIEASKNTQPIDRPINGELPACLTEAGSSKTREQTTGEREGLAEWNASETHRVTRRHGWRGGEGGLFTTGLITHKSIGWCVVSQRGLGRHEQVRRGSLDIRAAVRCLLELRSLGRSTGSWGLEEEREGISAPPFPIAGPGRRLSPGVFRGASGVRVDCHVSREETCQKALGWWIPATSVIVEYVLREV
ncbi:unnamed protein product [Pleuronectes platessa]|uniref:Uncharacterized protein n=1 Tax=Pleuronectes platessa TaxID=8262 RepID=A0A9N7VHZ4_PLEPL|nr:unnamed protein product [Pleuronectes platessa]